MTEESGRPLGEWLRQRREELGISLEQAQEDTRIRIHYLEALELDDLDALPSPVVARGFLRNYAKYLGLDPNEVAERYSGLVEPVKPEPLLVAESSPFDVGTFRPVPLHNMPGRRSRGWLLVGVLLIVVVALAFLLWQNFPYVTRWLASVMPVAGPSASGRATSVALATATYTPTANVAKTLTPSTEMPLSATKTQATPTLEITLLPTPTPSPSFTPTEPVYTGIFLEVAFTDTSWIQVTADGVREFQGELEAGTYRSWYGEERIELRIGNAGAVQVTVNGQKLGTFGGVGEVVDRVFEIIDDQVAEATVTAAPTLPPQAETATAEAPTIPTRPVAPTATITSTASP